MTKGDLYNSRCIKSYLILLITFSLYSDVNTTNDVESPNEFLCINPNCGYPNYLPYHWGTMRNGSEYEIYHLNRTAKLLKSQGFTVTVDVMFKDAIRILNYTNITVSGQLEFITLQGIGGGVGGRLSTHHRMHFMALLGQKDEPNNKWLCDGVLINEQWVLSRAACLFSGTYDINVIRLGEFDLTKAPESFRDNYSVDYSIDKVVVHPLYRRGSSYHDLVLIKLSQKIASIQRNISPICLPWGVETNRKHDIGSTLTLSGWDTGSVQNDIRTFKADVLTEAEFTVFNITKCANSYSDLTVNSSKFRTGMYENDILCAGSDLMKNSCKGDSGSPLVYQLEDGRMVLAALLTDEISCRMYNGPGLFTSINNPVYLQWIKEIAFDECSKMTTT